MRAFCPAVPAVAASLPSPALVALGYRARAAHRAGCFLPRLDTARLGDLADLVERIGDIVGRILAGVFKLAGPFILEGG